ncbi:MAG: hypothetical protein EXS05_04555 [Planctomycetaceae bacterium]|nr:hypothetical protein [Planctomycetaceae bacterium]
MPGLLPYRFLFRYSFPVRHEAKLPRTGKGGAGLPARFCFPDLGALDEGPGFAELRLAWNKQGLAISVEVRGKQRPLAHDPGAPDLSDGVQVWIDTRNTQSIHRAGRFCHHFCLLPRWGEGAGPVGVQLPIARAKELTPLADSKDIGVTAEVTKTGYRLDGWLPGRVLNGFDPEAQTRLGFYYLVRDAELGEQTLSVGSDFPYAFDPSLWSTIELTT